MPLKNPALLKAVKNEGVKINRAQEAKEWEGIGQARQAVSSMIVDYIHYMKTGEWTRISKKTKETAKLTHLVTKNNKGVYGVNIRYMTEALYEAEMEWKSDEEAIEWLEMFVGELDSGNLDEDMAFIYKWCTFRNKKFKMKKEEKAKWKAEHTPKELAEINRKRREEYKSKEWLKDKQDKQFEGIEWTSY